MGIIPNMGKVFIYGQIGKEVNSKEVVKEILSATGSLEVHINSPGGNVYEGLAIYNALQSKQNILTTYIDGLAFSAASWLAVSAKPGKRYMSKQSHFGIHQALQLAGGNKEDLGKQIDILNKIDEMQMDIYRHNTGLSSDRIMQVMKRDIPLSFAESQEFGFQAYEPNRIAALFNINNTNMDFEKLASLFKQAKGEEPVNEDVKAQTQDKVEAEHKEAETPAQALSADFTKKEDFENYKAITEPFMESVIDYIKEQPKTDDIKAMIKEAVNTSMVALLSQINTKGSVPAPEETDFAQSKQEPVSYEPLTLGDNVNFWDLKDKE